jgi:transcriptional regulator with XRE-family HTH domain
MASTNTSIRSSGLGGRLRSALAAAGITQTELADRLDVKQSAVSQWVTAQRTPDAPTIARIAGEVGATSDWLTSGVGTAPVAVRRSSLDKLRDTVFWTSRPAPEDGAREGGNANQFTIRPSLGNLVREAIQNSLDERLGKPTGPVRVLFRLLSLRGDAKKRYLDAMRWDELRPHIEESVSQAGAQQVGEGLAEALQTAESGELLILQIADFNTRGLIGPETGRGNFAGLTRDNLFSEKNIDSAGGSYGLGKAMQHAASAFNTVLYTSVLSEPEPETGNTAVRVFGRAELAYHSHDPSDGGNPIRCWGPAWFGERLSEFNPVSHWASDGDTLLEDLHMSRASDETGSTISIVGFHDLDADRDRTPREVIEQIDDEIGRYFWPAIEEGELEARVEYTEISNPETELRPEIDAVVMPERSSEAGPFVRALRAYRSGDVDESLVDEGDVVVGEVDLSIPAKKGEDGHGAFTHSAMVLVRRATVEEQLDERAADLFRHAGLVRGSNMVVSYLDATRSAVGAVPFHAVVLAGLAAGESNENRQADEFLRSAEPPSHDDWTGTQRLRWQYAPGWKTTLVRFQNDIRREIRRILAVDVDVEADGPQDLARRFRFGDAAGAKPERAPRIVVQSHSIREDGAWELEGVVRLRGDLSRTVVGRAQLVFLGESGSRSRVRWSTLEAVKNCSVEDGALVIAPHTRSATFKCASDPTSHPAPSRDAVVTILFQPAREEVV